MLLDQSAFIADPQLIEAFDGYSRSIPCDRARILFRQGDRPAGLYILHKGAATLSTDSPGGGLVITLQTTAGSLLDLPGVLCQKAHTLNAVALKDAVLSFVSHEDFTGLMESNLRLSERILRLLAAEVVRARREIASELTAGVGSSGLFACRTNWRNWPVPDCGRFGFAAASGA
ncbi:MAG: cyclic nucleotide-binding domain-containing protein [Terracidiphilus sp.]|jgi:CRP/FNR family transcriptional regulator